MPSEIALVIGQQRYPASDLAAIHNRLARLEEFTARLAGLLAAGDVLGMAKIVQREQVGRPTLVPEAPDAD